MIRFVYVKCNTMVKFLIQRPIAVTVTFIAFIVMSLVATGLLPVSLMPDIDIPEIVIKMSAQDKPAREMEDQYVSRIRRQLLQVSHLNDIESSASNGRGDIRLSFNFGTNINYAFIEVNEKIDAMMHQMPDKFERPRVIKTSATDIPVFYLNINLKDSLQEERYMELSAFCDQVIKKRVEQLPEVAMADISGIEMPEIVLQVDMDRLQKLGIDRETFIRALESNNYSVGNIKVRSGLYEFNVRYASLLKDRNDIENLYINIHNRIFRLKELADIQIRPKLDKGIYLANNKRSVVLAIIKKTNAQMSALKENTAELMKNLSDDYPRLNFAIERNQTDLLDYSIDNLKSGLLIGGLLAFFIMFLFLQDIKTPLLIGISIPVSVVISLMFFFLMRISINIISLSGLILGVGMMIDNAIIVIDNIVQYRNKGNSVFNSCIKGTNEVIRPLISSVLTTCAVFVPLIFLSGITGALFYDQAMAVAIGLGVSLLVSFTLIPVYFRLLYRKKQKDKETSSRRKKWMNHLHIFSHIEDLYAGSFDLIFRNHKIIFSAVGILIVAGYFTFGVIRKEKFPTLEQNEAVFSIDWNQNINVIENHNRMNRFLASYDSLLQNSSCMIGKQDFLLDESSKQDASETQLYIQAHTEDDLSILILKFKAYCHVYYPEAIVTIDAPPTLFEKVFNKKSAPLELRFKNKSGGELPSPQDLQAINARVTESTDIKINNKFRLQNYYEIAPDYERLLLYKVSVNELVNELKKSFNQLQIFTLKQSQYQVPIFLSGQEKTLYEIIQTTKVRAENNLFIPISSLVHITEHKDYKVLSGGKSDIFIALDYDVTQKQSKDVIAAYTQVLQSYPLIEMEIKGSLQENRALFKEMIIIMLVSLLLLYFILAAQFESLLQPLIVLIEIPIDIAAAVLILWVTGHSLNLMAFIGLIVITGIVINDSILKIDTINRLMKRGVPIMEAIHQGGTRRLKPIIMTSVTTILAMIPFLFGNDMGSRLQQPLAIVVIGGMFIGTLVSLYFIPLCYYYLKR